MIKLKTRFLSIFLATAIFSNLTPLQTSVYGLPINLKIRQNKRSLEKTKKKINENQNNRKKYEKAEKDLHNQIQQISVEIENLDKNMQALEGKIQQKQKEIDNIQKEIDNNNKLIAELNAKIGEINNKMDNVKKSMRRMCNKYYRLNKIGGSPLGRLLRLAAESETMGDFLRKKEYFNRQSTHEKNLINDFTGKLNDMRKLEKEKNNKLEQNLKLKKVADDNISSLQKNENELNMIRQNKWQRLSIVDQNLKHVRSKTEDMIRIEKQLLEAKKNYQEMEKHLNEQAAEQSANEQIGKQQTPKSADKTQQKVPADPNVKSSGKLLFPIAAGGRVSSRYGPRGKREFHHGWDICAPLGTPIRAAADGVVKFAGRTARGHGYGGYGICVEIQHANGISTLYAHMNNLAAGIRAGAVVKRGQIIGYVGHTGDAGVNHLHFEVRVNGRKVNPANYL